MDNTGSPEAEDFEEKSEYTEDHEDRAYLLKTIAAMANTRGGSNPAA